MISHQEKQEIIQNIDDDINKQPTLLIFRLLLDTYLEAEYDRTRPDRSCCMTYVARSVRVGDTKSPAMIINQS